MNGRRWGSAGWWGAAIALIVIAPVAAVTLVRAQESAGASRRLVRDLSIMEKIIDEMLLESRNFLVYSGDDNTRGLYLEEFGVLLSFQASLVNRGDSAPKIDWKDFRVEEKDGVIVIRPPDDDPGAGGDRDRSDDDDEDDEGGFRIIRDWRQRNRDVQQRLYTEGKEEILEILLDYGDSMTSLRDNQWLAIAAFLKRSDFFIEQRISRLVIKAKMGDLRAYADRRIDLEEMKKRVVEEEY